MFESERKRIALERSEISMAICFLPSLSGIQYIHSGRALIELQSCLFSLLAALDKSNQLWRCCHGFSLMSAVPKTPRRVCVPSELVKCTVRRKASECRDKNIIDLFTGLSGLYSLKEAALNGWTMVCLWGTGRVNLHFIFISGCSHGEKIRLVLTVWDSVFLGVAWANEHASRVHNHFLYLSDTINPPVTLSDAHPPGVTASPTLHSLIWHMRRETSHYNYKPCILFGCLVRCGSLQSTQE